MVAATGTMARVFGKEVKLNGMIYPRMAEVPDDAGFDALKIRQLLAQNIIIEIARDELPEDLPEPYQPANPQPVFLARLGMARLRVKTAQQDLIDAEADVTILEEGGVAGDVAIKGGGTYDGGDPTIVGNPDLPDERSPLDGPTAAERIDAEDADQPYGKGKTTQTIPGQDSLGTDQDTEDRTPPHLR